MSSYGDPAPEHRNAVASVNEARQRALKAVSELRQADIRTAHPNLAPPEVPAEGNDSPTLPVVCSQAVVDYLLQLRPYRQNSENWAINFGEIKLPKTISTDSKRRGKSGSHLSLQGDESIPLTDATEVIEAVNKTVVYQSVGTDNSLGGGLSVSKQRFKIVFSPQTLLRIVEAADEIAAEMDMLAELEPPDHGASGGDAV